MSVEWGDPSWTSRFSRVFKTPHRAPHWLASVIGPLPSQIKSSGPTRIRDIFLYLGGFQCRGNLSTKFSRGWGTSP